MNSRRYLLDTSAVLAFLEDEQGAARVESLLREQDVLLPWIVLLEVHYISFRERGQAEADLRYAMLRRAVAVIWDMSESILLTASRLKATYPISLADALVAAYAVREGATLVHKDPEYETLAGELDGEALPYRGATPAGGGPETR